MVHFISPLSDRIYKDTDETATAIPTTYQYSRSWFRIEFSCSISNRNHQVRHFSWNVNSSGVSKTPLNIYDWAFLRKKLNGLKLLINFEKTFHRCLMSSIYAYEHTDNMYFSYSCNRAANHGQKYFRVTLATDTSSNQRCSVKKFSYKFRKTHRKTPVPVSLF